MLDCWGMSTKRVQSNKISGNHSTLIEAAVVLVRAAVIQEEVRRVAPGFIVGGVGKLRTHAASVKFSLSPGGFKMTIHGTSSVQEVFVYSGDPATTLNVLAQVAHDSRYRVRLP